MYLVLIALISLFCTIHIKADTAVALNSDQNVVITESLPVNESTPENTEPVFTSPYKNLKLLTRTQDVNLCLSSHIKNKAEFEKKVYLITAKHGMDYELIMRQIKKESCFNPKAVSPAGAKGIAQFMPRTGKNYGLKTSADFFDPFKSIDAMVKHMSSLYKTYLRDKKLNPQRNKATAYKLALMAYNAGVGTVISQRGVPKYRETKEYIGYIYKNMNYQPQILH